MHEVVNLCLSEGNRGVPTLKACKQVAELVQQEVTTAGQNMQPVACKSLDAINTRLKFVAVDLSARRAWHRPYQAMSFHALIAVVYGSMLTGFEVLVFHLVDFVTE